MSTGSNTEVLCGSRKNSLNRQAQRNTLAAAFGALGDCGRKEAVDMVWTRFYSDRTRSWVNRNLDQLRAQASTEVAPDLFVEITYADPTGNEAVHRAVRPGCTCSHCTTHTNKKTAPMHESPNLRIEAVQPTTY